MQYIGKII